MKTVTRDGQMYRLPGALSLFQQELYLRLIDWKWRYITREAGTSGGIAYDAILPELYQRESRWPHLYPAIIDELRRHRVRNPFRIHRHFYHMASSQAANTNLFLPLLLHPAAASVLSAVKPDLAALATDSLDQGYCIEYWGGNYGESSAGSTGPLRDKAATTGTDADIAIAYRNHQGELCLWLIEHKLTETEFAACGGFKSRGRRERHDCTRSFDNILADKASCYYHDARGFSYWEITEANRALFVGHAQHRHCPFQGGLNQLWRNQLLALGVEQDARSPYKHVSFSVVRHRRNTALDASPAAYKTLIGHDPSFSAFTSHDIIAAADQRADEALGQWTRWYRELYGT